MLEEMAEAEPEKGGDAAPGVGALLEPLLAEAPQAWRRFRRALALADTTPVVS